jgi:hypothetical protein
MPESDGWAAEREYMEKMITLNALEQGCDCDGPWIDWQVLDPAKPWVQGCEISHDIHCRVMLIKEAGNN